MSEEELELLKLADDKLEQLAYYMTQLAITQERTEGKLEQLIESQKNSSTEVKNSFAEVRESFVELRHSLADLKNSFIEDRKSFAELRATVQQQAETAKQLVGIVDSLLKQ
jgi:methyl-accepting chemotaxis protein